MTVYWFDGTFDGLLTAVFDSFHWRESPDALLSRGMPEPLFCDVMREVVTDAEKAGRVWRKLCKVVSRGACSALVTAFLTDDVGFPSKALSFVRRAVVADDAVEKDFSDPSVLAVLNECRRVRGEAHRLLQFVRFQKAADGTYFSVVEPLFDVLPMVTEHFRDRFSDQPFVLYDRVRDYGYYYDRKDVRRMRITSRDYNILTGRLSDDQMDEEERLYQRLWRTYFNAVAIPERCNPRKQRSDMPVRYWKYLTEVNGGV